MYQIGRRVVINAPGSGYDEQIGYIADRHWAVRNGKRQAVYMVEFRVGLIDPITTDVDGLSSKQLIPYDGWCDQCDKPRRRSQLENICTRDGEVMLTVCWYCENVTKRDYPEPTYGVGWPE